MQSQQKRVKWSRGETAEALEERTDTGITQASVELMENCIPDIYGNISRRPGLKAIPIADGAGGDPYLAFAYDEYLQVIPFYITENDYILIGVHFNAGLECLRIKDNKVVYRYIGDSSIYPRTSIEIDGVRKYRPISYAQQGNYLLIADAYNVWQINFTITQGQYNFSADATIWSYSAGWYATNGTNTKSIDSSILTGLNFQGNSIKNYIFTESNGQTVVYSSIKTGITLAAVTNTWIGTTTTYYVHSADNGLAIRIDTNSSHALSSWTMTNNTSYTNGQTMTHFTDGTGENCHLRVRIEADKAYFYVVGSGSKKIQNYTYDVSQGFSNQLPGISVIEQEIPIGSIVQFPNNGGYMRVEGYDSDGTDMIMYGPLLTPIADDTATDTSVNVEYGFTSLQPSTWSSDGSYPHPTKLAFLDQRLWAGGWAYSATEQYALTIGSQVAKYSDFKNDYNKENESITLDILTQYQERIIHLIDYNSLKIMTDSNEYTYDEKAVKQSANGSFEYCDPLIFDAMCLYVDSTGCQVKAMQYEFKNNIFDSTTINQLAPHDLVWYPWAMAAYEDKVNSTGKYLFLVNRKDANARLAVCNFVPGNQANIWSRWVFPYYTYTIGANTYIYPLIHGAINLKNGTIFLVSLQRGTTIPVAIVPAVLDFDVYTDLESPILTLGTTNYFAPWNTNGSFRTMQDTEVAVYANGEFKFTTTTNQYGAITADLTGLTNITVGLPINSKIVSHPIDVGGKTKSIKKRIGKAVMSVHNTASGAITINGKTGYINPQNDKINFYGVTGMKDEIKYTITNNNGAMFHLESLLMNIEYGTLDS